MRKQSGVIVALGLLLAGSVLAERPHVLFIVSEDNGEQIGCYGESRVHTPHLDSLAGTGVRYDRAYVPYSVCSPSRAAFLTGLYPRQTGHIGLATHRFSFYREFKTMPAYLREAGYFTGFVGKTHLNPAGVVEDHIDFRGVKHANFNNSHSIEDYAREARTIFERAKEAGKPFLAILNYSDAHRNFVGTSRAGYPTVGVAGDTAEPLPWIGVDTPRIRKEMRNYLTCMNRLDEGVGMVLEDLEELGMRKNTLVIYLADHGADFPRGKTSCYEGGVRVPMIVNYPKSFRGGTVESSLVSSLDILPTVLEEAGIALPAELVGIPLQRLQDEDAPRRRYIHTFNTGSAPSLTYLSFGIRDERWKLIHNPVRTRNLAAVSRYDNSSVPSELRQADYVNPPEFELYDLKNDPHEFDNLAAEPELRSRRDSLFKAMREFQEEIGDPFLDPDQVRFYVDEMADPSSHPKKRSGETWSHLGRFYGEFPEGGSVSPGQEESRGTGFETVAAGEIAGEVNSDGLILTAGPGNAFISDTHAWKGRQGLHLLGGENRELIIRFTEAVPEGKVIAFQAERWTRRDPFEFRISARNHPSGEWAEVFDGKGKIVVGREFLSPVVIPLSANVSELKLTATTPQESGVLIDELRVLDEVPPGMIPQEPEHRIKLRHLGQDGVHSTRIPGLATTNAGTLIAVYDNRNRGPGDLPGDIDVGMSRSTDGGTTWEPMRVIMDMGDDPGWSYDGIGDPSVLVDRRTGTIWVAATWSHGERSWHGSGPGMEPEETGQFMLVKSEDDGRTWSDPVNITTQIKDPEWRFVLAGPGKGITMKDGTLVFPAQFRGADREPIRGKPFSTLIYSKDRGKSWTIGTGVKIDTTEAQLVELGDGSLMINCRDNRGGSRSVYTTNDLGKTWQVHSTSRGALPEPVCMASLIRVDREKFGPLLFFSNPNQSEGRARMTIKVSRDEGLTWPEKWHHLVDAGPSAYSCLTAIGEDRIGLLYEIPGELVFVRYRIEDLVGETAAGR